MKRDNPTRFYRTGGNDSTIEGGRTCLLRPRILGNRLFGLVLNSQGVNIEHV